ncbi:hypothetical protein [Aquabacterium humicola]|uniref:hypothetical protein n=1 Tax=Aquabacterium humicola TaxID=3237377 RepID=UPI002542FFEF|nr:hypothetical protein [Rubrivivax pictus]
MNSPMPRALRRAALAVSTAALTTAAGAHSFVFTLGDAAAATHYFGVICSGEGGNDTDHLFLELRTTTSNAPAVSAQVIKGPVATNTTDPVGGDVAFSPATRTRGGNGLYQVLINKAGPGVVTFAVNAHCLDVTGTQHTGTDGVVYQYQDR